MAMMMMMMMMRIRWRWMSWRVGWGQGGEEEILSKMIKGQGNEKEDYILLSICHDCKNNHDMLQ